MLIHERRGGRDRVPLHHTTPFNNTNHMFLFWLLLIMRSTIWNCRNFRVVHTSHLRPSVLNCLELDFVRGWDEHDPISSHFISHPLNLPLKNDKIKHPLSVIGLAAARGFCELDTIPGNFQEVLYQVYGSRWPSSFSLEAFRCEAKLAKARISSPSLLRGERKCLFHSIFWSQNFMSNLVSLLSSLVVFQCGVSELFLSTVVLDVILATMAVSVVMVAGNDGGAAVIFSALGILKTLISGGVCISVIWSTAP